MPEAFPQSWDISIAPRDAFFFATDIVFRCGGEIVRDVRAYNIPEGWIIGICPGAEGKGHTHPQNRRLICERVYHGKVEISRERQ